MWNQGSAETVRDRLVIDPTFCEYSANCQPEPSQVLVLMRLLAGGARRPPSAQKKTGPPPASHKTNAPSPAPSGCRHPPTPALPRPKWSVPAAVVGAALPY